MTDQPDLKKLSDELHDLRLDAGLPSARTIRDHVGEDAQDYWIVNHQAVPDAFRKPDLPPWGPLRPSSASWPKSKAPARNAPATVLAEADTAEHNAATVLNRALGRPTLDDARSPARALTWRIRRLGDRHAPSPRAQAVNARHASQNHAARARDTVAAITGRPSTLFRSPYGAMPTAARLAARRLGLTPVLWTCREEDRTARATAESVRRTVTRDLDGGKTIPLHDSGCTSAPGA